MNQWQEAFEKKQRIKKAMERLKYETAEELGLSIDDVPSDGSPQEIGTFTGPVGGRMVQKLVQQAQQQLMEKHQAGEDHEG